MVSSKNIFTVLQQVLVGVANIRVIIVTSQLINTITNTMKKNFVI